MPLPTIALTALITVGFTLPTPYIFPNYTQAGQGDQALRVAQDIKPYSYKDRDLAEQASSYAEAGQYNQAEKVAQSIQYLPFKAGALANIAGYCTIAGQKQKASELLSQALQVVQAIKSTKEDDGLDKVSALVDIAIEYAAIGQYDLALNLAQTIQSLTFGEDIRRPMTLVLSGIAGHYAASGQQEKAAKTLHQALEFDKLYDDSRCSLELVEPMLREIANRYEAAGQHHQALHVSKIIGEFRLSKSIDKKSRKVKSALTVYAGCG